MGERSIITERPNLAAWELQQLVKAGLYLDQESALRSALRAVFQTSPQTRVRMVISVYEAGDVSLGNAAAMLGVSQEEMKDICERQASRFTWDHRRSRSFLRMPEAPEAREACPILVFDTPLRTEKEYV